jgi:hypothetical protein
MMAKTAEEIKMRAKTAEEIKTLISKNLHKKRPFLDLSSAGLIGADMPLILANLPPSAHYIDLSHNDFSNASAKTALAYMVEHTDITLFAFQGNPQVGDSIKEQINKQAVKNKALKPNPVSKPLPKTSSLTKEREGELRAMMKQPYVDKGLLELSGKKLTAADIPFIGEHCPKNTPKINLTMNDIGGADFKSFGHLRNLEELNFFRARIGTATKSLQGLPQSLKNLNLSDNNIGDAGVGGVVGMVNTHPSLETLNLNANDIGIEGAEKISTMLDALIKKPASTSLTTITYSNNPATQHYQELFNKKLATLAEIRKRAEEGEGQGGGAASTIVTSGGDGVEMAGKVGTDPSQKTPNSP